MYFRGAIPHEIGIGADRPINPEEGIGAGGAVESFDAGNSQDGGLSQFMDIGNTAGIIGEQK